MANDIDLLVDLVSTWKPRHCGIATYSYDEATNLLLYGGHIRDVIPHPIDIDDLEYCKPDDKTPLSKDLIIRQLYEESWDHAADVMIEGYHANNLHGISSLALLEHEYGNDGDGTNNYFNLIARRVRRSGEPVIAELHTVLKNPNAHQRRVFEDFGENCNRLIAKSYSSVKILQDDYHIPSEKTFFLPHGIPETHKGLRRHDAKKYLGLENRLVVATPGLLSENKGVVYAVEGFAQFVDMVDPDDRRRLLYLVPGVTHPEILKKNNWRDPYREMCFDLAKRLELNPVSVTTLEQLRELDTTHKVIFWNNYLTENETGIVFKACDLGLFPYTVEEQDVSGNLAKAFGYGRTPVTTPFRGAMDMLTDSKGNLDGSGVVVEKFNDPKSIAEGLKGAFQKGRDMEIKAYQKGVVMGWSVVARQMANLMRVVVEEESGVESTKISFVK